MSGNKSEIKLVLYWKLSEKDSAGKKYLSSWRAGLKLKEWIRIRLSKKLKRIENSTSYFKEWNIYLLSNVRKIHTTMW